MNRQRARELFDDVRDGVRAQPGRAGLTFATIALAAAALAVLLAILGGLQEKARRISRELGADVMAAFQPGRASLDPARRLGERHLRLLRRSLPGWSHSAVRVFEVPTLGSRRSVSVVATDEALLGIRAWRLAEGRFLDELDLRERRRSAVVSASLARLWNWRVGDLVMLERTPFKIVGAVEWGGASDAPSGHPDAILGERVVFVPVTVRAFEGSEASGPAPTVDAIFLRAPPGEDFGRAVGAAQRLLAQDPRLEGVSWATPDTLVEGVRRLQRTLALALGSVVLLCLASGGTTLMSLMVANVKERVAEIGLRRALGATPGDIAALFTAEACTLAFAAAAAAVAATHLALALGRPWIPVPLKLGPGTALTPLLVALGVAAAFSRWPAKRAAAIAPSEALRND